MASRGNERTNGNYFIYDNHTKEKYEVTEEVYKAYYQELWRQRKEMQKLGKCVCPMAKLWMCDGDCLSCRFSSDGSMTQIDDDGQITGRALDANFETPEDICGNMDELDFARRLLSEMDPDGEQIFNLLLEGIPVSKIARALNRPQSSCDYQIRKYRAELKAKCIL